MALFMNTLIAVVLAVVPLAAASAKFAEWQVLETRTGLPLAFEDLASHLAAEDVIYLAKSTTIAIILKWR